MCTEFGVLDEPLSEEDGETQQEDVEMWSDDWISANDLLQKSKKRKLSK